MISPTSFVIDGTAPHAFKDAVAKALVASLPLTVKDAIVFSGPLSDVITSSRVYCEHVALQQRCLLRIDDAKVPAVASSDGQKVTALYHYRYVCVPSSSTVQDVVADVECAMGRDMSFVSTRGTTMVDGSEPTFLTVVREGLCVDGGLFVPRRLPTLLMSQVEHLAMTSGLTYQDVAQVVLERLVASAELPPGVLQGFVEQAYEARRWTAPDVCPLTPLHLGGAADWDANEQVKVLELYHGPTAAFKDFALQLFPYTFSLATSGLGQYMILAATSGDTGVAAIVGFQNSAPDTKVMVLYPRDGVSPVQKLQMQSSDDGARVRVFGVDGDFDFCQNTVKQVFTDAALNASLRDSHQLTLSSANSINYGRLIPQIVYYFWAYRRLVQDGTIQKFGDKMDVCVPSGNFGNLLSCYLAKKMGLPVGRMVLASNVNDVLYEFISTGVYDISRRSLQTTASPSIDILKASNVERFLYYIMDGDTTRVSAMMEDLQTKKRFELSSDEFAKVRADFWALRCDEHDCSATIRDTFAASNGQRLLDPHTAVAVFVAKKYLEAHRDESIGVPMVVCSTAHWAKFPAPVLAALQPQLGQEANTSDTKNDACTEVRALYAAIASLSAASTVHPALSAAVAKAESSEAHTNRTASRSFTEIVAELQAFAGVLQ